MSFFTDSRHKLYVHILVLRGMNCKFAGVAMCLSTVKQGLRYKKILNSYSGMRVLSKVQRSQATSILTHYVSIVLLPYGGRGQKSPNHITKITIFEFCMKARQIVSF